MSTKDNPRPRPTVRLVVIDDTGRILLFGGRSRVSHDRYWFTPGGGIDPGETLEVAARREMREETGLEEFDFGPQVWHRKHVIELDGEWIEIEEWAHLVRVDSFDVDTSGFTQIEIDTISEHGWWTLNELKMASDRLAPPNLPEIVSCLLCELRLDGTIPT